MSLISNTYYIIYKLSISNRITILIFLILKTFLKEFSQQFSFHQIHIRLPHLNYKVEYDKIIKIGR